jgi:hypothetical protein
LENERLCVCEKKLKKPKDEIGSVFITFLSNHILFLVVPLIYRIYTIKRGFLEKFMAVASLNSLNKKVDEAFLLFI